MKQLIKRIAFGILLALPWIGAASAQQTNIYCVVNPLNPPYQWVPCQTQTPLSTVNIGPDSQASLSFSNGQPLSLFVEDFGSGTLNTSTRWNRPTTGGGGNATAATNAVGQTTIGTGTTANGYSLLQSQRTIWDRNPGYNYFQTNVNIPIPTVTNAYMLFGFATVPTTPTAAAPATNAAAFEFGTNGKLSAVTFASGTRQLIADLSVAQSSTPGSTTATTGAAGTYTGGCNCTPQISTAKSVGLTITDSYKYVIVFRGDNILWYIEQPNGNLGLVAYTTRGAVGLDVNQVPVTYLAVANTSGPTATATLQINQVTVGDTGKNLEPGFDRASYPTQALSAVNDSVGVSAMGAGSCTFTTASNTNVTLVFEATDPNGSTWTAVTAYPWGGGAGIQTVPSGTNGQWTVPCGGFNQVRMRVSVVGATPTVLGTASASIAAPGVANVVAASAVGITPTDRTVTSATGSSQTIAAANTQRHSLTIVNTGNANCGVNPTGGTAAIGGAGTITLAPLGAYTPRIPTLSAVTVICTAGQPIYGDEN